VFAFRLQNFGSKDGTIFCGVFDGHGPQGHLVSKMVRDLLPVKLSANIARDEYKELSNNSVTNGTTEGDAVQTVVEDTDAALGAVENGGYPEIFTALRTSFLRAFYVMDRDLKSHKNIDCLFSGTTAVTLIKQVLFVATMILLYFIVELHLIFLTLYFTLL
jgi:serine/threonine protein phosphatase PrpC